MHVKRNIKYLYLLGWSTVRVTVDCYLYSAPWQCMDFSVIFNSSIAILGHKLFFSQIIEDTAKAHWSLENKVYFSPEVDFL